MAEGARELSGLFYKSTNPIHEGSNLRPNHLRKAPPPTIIALGVRISTYEFWRVHIFSLYQYSLPQIFWMGKKNHLITLKQVPLPAIPIVEDKQAEMVKTPNSFSFEKRATELGWKQHLTSAVLRVPAPP